jgi:hypothetical protein
MRFIPSPQPIHLWLRRSGNPRLLRQKPLLLKVLLQKTATLLSLPIVFLLTVSGGKADSARLKAPESYGAPNDPATVLRVKLQLQTDSPILEIMSSRPVRPVITKTQHPPGLRIDLGNAQMSVRHKEITVENALIDAIQLDQTALSPPVVSIIVNERKPLSYTWDAAGNRLRIRLHMESEEAKARPLSVPVLTRHTEVEPVAVPLSTGGAVMFADRQASGSAFSAGFRTETLRLSRGGVVHICPGTTVSIIHPQNGGDLLLAMGVGALETHYALEESADTILTPDFRILLRGPGEFHYAIRADSRGNTCVRALPGNTAPVVVYESIGNGQFEVVPSEKLVFHGGHLSATDTAFHSGQLSEIETVIPDDCGCPSPVPVLRAELPAASPPVENNIPSKSAAPQSTAEAALTRPTERQNVPDGPEIATSFPLATKEKTADFEATLVFSQKGPPPPMPVDLPLSSRGISFPDAAVAPPALPRVMNQKAHKGVLRKVTRFFSRIFG